MNKGVNEFIVNSKNPVNATLLRDKETEGPGDRNDFEVSYQIENGTGKLNLGQQIFDAGKPFMLSKGISELEYLPETLGEHKLIIRQGSWRGNAYGRIIGYGDQPRF